MNPQRWLMRFAAFALAWWVQTALAQPEKALSERAAKTGAIMESKNVEINFFGKVIDQNDQPLEGVKIQGHTREWKMKNAFEPEGKFTDVVAVTGADGQFSFTRLKGDSFQIVALAKEGYTLSSKAIMAFSYGPLARHYSPNPLQPALFRMWKKLGSVPLYAVNVSATIPQDGTIVSFDLRRNKQVLAPGEEADIRITLNHHAPAGQRNTRVPFDWSFDVEVPDGGVLLTQDEFVYLAPEQGYQSKWSVTHPKDEPNWKARGDVEFYLHNRAGQQFGWLSVRFEPEAGYPKGSFFVRGYLNPTGRVLEFDLRHALRSELATQPETRFGLPTPTTGSSPQPANGAATPPPGFPPPGFPALPPQFTPPTNNPAFLQPPPGFQALTNRGRPFPPPAPPRPPQ